MHSWVAKSDPQQPLRLRHHKEKKGKKRHHKEGYPLLIRQGHIRQVEA